MKVEGGEKYRVRLVPTTGRREELIFEIFAALDHVGEITDEIFSKIQQRITSQKVQISSLKARLDTATTKVSNLKNSTKLIHVVSPAKYPEAPEFKGIPQLYPTLLLRSMRRERQNIDSQEFLSRIGSNRIFHDSSVKEMDELLRVSDLNYSKASSLAELGRKYEFGLGSPSHEFQHLDSFVLFNTDTNPYKNYVVSDGTIVGGAPSGKGTRKMDSLPVPDPPPAKTAGKSEENAMRKNDDVDDFYYNPSSVQIPEIDLPDHLPCLPGLSDTISFESSSDNIPGFVFNVPTTLASNHSHHTPASVSPPVLASITAEHCDMQVKFTPPPPPPPLPDFAISASEPEPRLSPAAMHVLCPPPPPPPLPQSNESTEIPAPPRAQAKGIGSDDLRGTLMAAIRSAGGKSKLKSTREVNTVKEKGNDASGGDLLEDLKNSLAMRRRGISGRNESGKSPGIGEIMKRMSSIIPPPAGDDPFNSQHGNLSEDDDWD